MYLVAPKPAFGAFPWFAAFSQSSLLALLGRQLLGPKVGLLAAGLLAVSPLQIELSNEARTYALLQLVAIANTWFFVRWVQRERMTDLVVYGIDHVLSAGTLIIMHPLSS